MIGHILPPEVSAAEAFADPPDAELFPEEAAIVARAVPKRRNEFTTGRLCARTALGKLGVTPGPILTGERGAPQWPPGIVGSITHCAGYRAAAVARADDIVTIGIDAEPNGVLPDGVLDTISIAPERARLRRLAGAGPGICWDRLLFSAKESVYKAWFPLARSWLGFSDADISIDPDDGSFDVRLLATGRAADGPVLTGFSGRWLVADGIIVTTIAVPASSGM